ncbi:hypothetical protein [Sporosalibacterium faouarense]|uniref:hypothetical protein n=1 Tax=Sporosalibacterium faouarense TaxID=516123 RepID=UPI00141C3DCB|nr:hypothetical protein [Sporosalibacterium faouarense]MTI48125.1 hypothetical protein [Bacillota bacterium]
MLLGLFDIKYIIAVLLTGVVIKLMDDYIDLDQEGDSFLVNNMNRGLLPYSLIILSMACSLDIKVTVSLISSAYMVGMFKDGNRKLSFKLKGYQESLIIAVIFSLLLGFHELLSSLVIISIIQLTDDIIDIRKDRYFNNKNFILEFGFIEVILLNLILILAALKLDFKKFIISIIVFFALQAIEFFFTKRILDERDEPRWI